MSVAWKFSSNLKPQTSKHVFIHWLPAIQNIFVFSHDVTFFLRHLQLFLFLCRSFSLFLSHIYFLNQSKTDDESIKSKSFVIIKVSLAWRHDLTAVTNTIYDSAINACSFTPTFPYWKSSLRYFLQRIFQFCLFTLWLLFKAYAFMWGLS